MKSDNIDKINLIEEYELVFEKLKYFYPNISFNGSDLAGVDEIFLTGNEPKYEPDSLFSIFLFFKLQIQNIISDYGNEIFNQYLDVFRDSKILPVDGDIYSPIETIQVLGLYPNKDIIENYIQQISEVSPIMLKHIGNELSGDSEGYFKSWDDYLNFTKMFKPHFNDFMSKLTASIMEFSVRLRIENNSTLT